MGAGSPLQEWLLLGGGEGAREKPGILQDSAWPTCLSHCQQVGVGGGDLGNRPVGTVHPAWQSQNLWG